VKKTFKCKIVLFNKKFTDLREMNNFPVIFFFTMTKQPQVGQSFLFIEASRSHSDTSHSAGLLRTSDQPHAQTSTWQHTTLTRDRILCPRRHSNPQSQPV